MKIKVRYLTNDVIHIKKLEQGNWYDLRSAVDMEIKQGEYKLIPLGIAIKLPLNFEAYIVPRSSTYKNFGLIQANHFGVVDSSYSGNNDQWYFSCIAMRDTIVHKNDRICQFRINKKQPEFDIEEVDDLGDKNRGGFGTTGIN